MSSRLLILVYFSEPDRCCSETLYTIRTPSFIHIAQTLPSQLFIRLEAGRCVVCLYRRFCLLLLFQSTAQEDIPLELSDYTQQDFVLSQVHSYP